ncbi:uncharacterized protein LOC129919053 isoform X2 [Episyrphus balteatus]|uniref:uncharacterized protein LOC129919053 isoform X2 n=1 Tax=Episyrphus balteatus TaxID=286459 RepID=UPI00248535E6|nr:uncharacterized protein LOC129919053 isoform X2 [Episyrphus balteatus]
MLLQGFLIGFTLLIHGFGGGAHAESGTTISEHVGKTVELPCPMNMTVCGALHSINWFKGETRIAAVLLDDSNITSVSEGYKDRVIVEQSPFKLIIKDLQISDEDIYLCDTTFFIPLEACDNYYGYRVKLNVLVPPTEVVIVDEKGDRIENGTVLGPLQEGHTLRSTCIVKNTRPQPSVGWFRANKRLTTHSPTYDEKDGLYTATLELSLVLTRQDLGNTIECRVESSAIQGTIRSVIDVDMQVRPTGITLSGVEHHTVQGSKVVLTCQVYGARPAVNISWSNSSVPIVDEDNALTEIRTHAVEQNDGTFHTVSDLIFNASRFENDMVFRCDADNVVLQMNREKPIYSFVTLEVMYPPVVKVSPPHITVNTSDTVLLNCEYVANPATLTSVKWYRNTDLVNVNDTDRYEGGNSENVALVIKSTDKRDIGNYSCHLSNSITSGKGVSETQIELDVQYVPIVEVLMTPEGPVKESDESNVTLYCNIVDANPSQLTKVRWYANSSLLKELPDCTETNEDLCHIDPSKLLLESIGRGFFYNYSCEGFNAAGWGPRSDDKELMVHYEPGPATLTHFPLIAVKKKSVTFSCSVDDPGYPESNRFRWFRGGRGPLQDVVTKDWTVEPVGLDSRTNYSCYAYNEGGHGVPATVNLEVHAPPFFIKNLFPYTGIVFSSRNASLMCRIECVPRCTISWYKDGIALGPDNERYFVKEEYMAASPATGDFESVMSVLHFNMTAWPNKRFDIDVDSANYSCVSSNNAVGPGIKSATYFSIEYAPENTTVTDEVVHVLESNIPGRVVCKSKANPEPSYEWRFNNKTITRGSTLIINNPMSRNDTGRYTCVAFNKHGSSVSDTFIDVQFKPKCEIERREIDDKDTLICTAFGNPVEADFSWSIKAENDSVETLGNGKINKDKSFYILDEDYAIARTYRCVANNSVGAGTFCEIEVAEQLAWWQRWDKTTLIILVAAVLALLLAVIIICCIIICICRRRRRQDKLHDKSSSLGDPLTEPGEYENLPFHGLQTAPNKFTTTPTNFNNNTNVVRVAPRPKRLTTNHDTINNQQQQQLTHHQYHSNIQNHHQQLQQQQTQQQQQSYNTIEYNRNCNPSMNNTIKSTRSSAAILDSSNSIGIPPPPPDHQYHPNQQQHGPQQLTYTLNNCFPKSYTEYYHQQQQQKFSTSNSQLLNSIEHNYPYTVVERGSSVTGTGNAVAINNNGNNPFLAGAGDFKKFDTSSGGSMHRTKRSKGHSNTNTSGAMGGGTNGGGGMLPPDGEKKFYSLKFPGNKKSHHHLNSIKPVVASGGVGVPTIGGAGNKCKRHHSFAGAGDGDVVGASAPPQPTYATPMQSKMRFYEPPVYENLNDSIQIHECQVDTHHAPAVLQQKERLASNPQLQQMQQHHHKKRHHQHLHQKKVDDFNLIEPERLSIYRSDSGISNSSYECVTPVPAPRVGSGATVIPPSPATLTPGKTQTNRNVNTKSHTTTPVYMNVDGTAVGGGASSTSPFESPSSQNDPSAVDPASVSSCQSLYSTTNRCGRHPGQCAVSGLVGSGGSQQEVTTPEDGSSSAATVTGNTTSSSGKCKRRTPSSCSASLQSLERAPNTTTNPFLATNNHSTSSSSGCASSSGGSTSASNHSQSSSSRIHRTASSTSSQFSHPSTVAIKSSISPSKNNNNNSTTNSSSTKQQMLISNNSQNHNQQQKEIIPQPTNSSSGSATDGEVSSEDPSSHPASITATTDMDSIRKTNGSSVLLGALNNSTHSQYQQQQHQQQHPRQQHQNQTSKKHHPGYTTRPVRLPLRKHHSFHFQPSQTVAGIRSKHRLKHSNPASTAAAAATCNGSSQLGLRSAAGLFLNENSAFKPISPVEHISSSSNNGGAISSRLVSHELIQGNFKEIKAKSTTDGRPIPRICGTSLKRHLSNVETYDSSRYNKQLQHYNHHQRRIKHHRNSEDDDDEEDDDDDDDDDVDFDEEVDSDDEEDDISSCVVLPSSNQVVYADVLKPAPLSSSLPNTHRDDLAISSDSEMIQRSQFSHRQKDSSEYPNCRKFSNQRNITSARTSSCRSIDVDPDYTFCEDEDPESLTSSADVTIFSVASSPARQRTTQYVSARNFNEVKI